MPKHIKFLPEGLLVGFAIAASAFVYYAPGFAQVRYYWPISSSRFLLPAVALAAVVGVFACRARWCAAALRAVVVFQMLFYVGYGSSLTSLLGTVVLLAGLAVIASCAVHQSVAARHPVEVLTMPLCSECHKDGRTTLDHRADFTSRHGSMPPSSNSSATHAMPKPSAPTATPIRKS